MPPWLLDGLRSSKLIRDLARRWAGGRDLQIATGSGAGLRFNAGPSNPAYGLGTNERPVQEELARHLHPGDIFFDIGANVGFFTVIGAKLVGPTGRVFAFEPAPANADRVRHNVALNSFANVTLLEKAVAQHAGQAELLVTSYSGGAALASVGTLGDVQERIAVEVVSIDELIAQGALQPPTFVKIDVEGAELDVLRGMVDTLATHKPLIIYEVDDEDEGRFQQKLAACATYLREHEYQARPLADSYQNSDWYVGHVFAAPLKM
jgi:FkbM family methyltransferase